MDCGLWLPCPRPIENQGVAAAGGVADGRSREEEGPPLVEKVSYLNSGICSSTV